MPAPEAEGRGGSAFQPSRPGPDTASPLRPAVFLDRDGTLIEEANYLSDPDQVELIPGAVEALTLLRDHGYALVVVTNQSGIARGFYGLKDYEAVARRLDEILEGYGLVLDATRFCPHHPDFTGECSCRKPATGMHRDAAEVLGLDLAASWFVGDKLKDLLPSLELGGQGILVRTGYGPRYEDDLPPAFQVADDLLRAALVIVYRGG